MSAPQWTVLLLPEAADELDAQPDDIRARFFRIVELIEGQGLQNMREPHVKHIEGKLWEIRLKGRDGIARALYVTANERRVMVVRVFAKKTQKTPRQEIRLALQRAEDIE
jgi:phage-related protein